MFLVAEGRLNLKSCHILLNLLKVKVLVIMIHREEALQFEMTGKLLFTNHGVHCHYFSS